MREALTSSCLDNTRSRDGDTCVHERPGATGCDDRLSTSQGDSHVILTETSSDGGYCVLRVSSEIPLVLGKHSYVAFEQTGDTRMSHELTTRKPTISSSGCRPQGGFPCDAAWQEESELN